jgi:hypothetical protein
MEYFFSTAGRIRKKHMNNEWPVETDLHCRAVKANRVLRVT